MISRSVSDSMVRPTHSKAQPPFRVLLDVTNVFTGGKELKMESERERCVRLLPYGLVAQMAYISHRCSSMKI